QLAIAVDRLARDEHTAQVGENLAGAVRQGSRFLQDATSLADSSGKVFADLRGVFVASKAVDSDGQLDL
ncbi:hypothetical protein QCD79_35025, partial [Pseudomonas quasicaspiana]|nr:hypothetical protein [Pseudomonas quasicaspiana]